MLHTVFYDTRNALLSVRVWRVRAVRSSSNRWRDRRTMLVESDPVERGGRRVRVGLDVAGLALTGQHSAASALLCSDIAYRRRAPAWARELLCPVQSVSISLRSWCGPGRVPVRPCHVVSITVTRGKLQARPHRFSKHHYFTISILFIINILFYL